MTSFRKFLLIIFIVVPLVGHPQSAAKVRKAGEKAIVALAHNDTYALTEALDQYPILANLDISGKPFLYFAVEQYLQNEGISLESIRIIMNHNADLYCSYNNTTPFYLVLKYLATTPRFRCQRAESLFYTFMDNNSFDSNKAIYKLPPPLPYLLNTNQQFLGGKFSKDYLSDDVVVTLVAKGSSINSRTANSNSLLAFATECGNQDLIDFCLGKNADLSIKTQSGMDPMCIAIANKDMTAIKSILNNGYLTAETIRNTPQLTKQLAKASEEIINECFNALKSQRFSVEDFATIKKVFPGKSAFFITDGYSRNNFNVSGSEIPALIQQFNEYSSDPVAAKHITDLKKEYIFSASNLADLYSKLNQYPLYSINYTKNYYEKESSFYSLISSLEKNKDNFPLSFYNSMISEAKNECSGYINEDRSSVSAYVQLLNDYGKFFKENPSKYNELETKVFNRFIRYVEYFGYSNEDFPEDISSAISMAKKNLSNSTAFMQKFTNPEFLNIAAEQKKKSLNYIERMEPVYKEALINYSDFIVKYNQLISYIVKDGRVPNYQYTSDKHDVIEIECWPTDITCNVSYEDGKYELSVRGLLGNYGRVSGASLGECVKKIVMDDKRLYYIAGDVSNYDRYSVKLSSDDYRKFKEHYTHLVTKYNKDWWNCTLREL